MILFLSKKESEAFKVYAIDRIDFFSNQFHSARISMKNLGPYDKDYITFGKEEMRKAEESVKFWEGILNKLN